MKPHNPDVPLTAVYGIGERNEQRLIENGIHTCQELAVADPETVAQALKITTETAAEYITAAKTTLGYF